MRRLAIIALAVFGAAAASAQEPTIDQLLATPTPVEIVERWKGVCFDHAGDAKAQKEAVKASGLTWPYQAYFHRRGKKVDCIVASSTKAGSSIRDFAGPLGIAMGQPPEAFKVEDTELSADIEVGGNGYRVGASSTDKSGNLVSTIILLAK